MADGQANIRFGISFDADTSGLVKMKNAIQELLEVPARKIDFFQDKDIQKTSQQLGQMRQQIKSIGEAFEKSFSNKYNTLNLTTLNNELTKIGANANSLKTIGATFNNMGVYGKNAFNTLTKEALTTNTQLKTTSTLVEKMAMTFSNTIRWQIASNVINTFTGRIQEAYGYVKNLDSSLNDIRIVTSNSADQMERFAIQANKAAQDLGAKTTEYTNAALIYYQQGLSDAVVKSRTEATIKAANVTQQSAYTVSEQLTAVWNGYKVNAQEAELYVDKLAAVAAKTAADLEELTTGMSKVASAANNMGVDIDQLNAQIATIVSVTRQAPESVGTALKTIFARTSDIEAGLDTETTLGEYTEKMAEMGINVLDANKHLRDQGEVIEEIGNKWKSMSREQQVSLAQVMAGTRQYNNLLALFDNWDMYNKALATSQNAVGTLQHQQDIYMDSVDAHLQRMKTSWENVYDSMFDENTIKDFTDAITTMTTLMAHFLDSIGGGIEALLTLGSVGLKVFNVQIGNGIANVISNMKKVEFNRAQEQAAYAVNQQLREMAVEVEGKQAEELIQIKELQLNLKDYLTVDQKEFFNNMIKRKAEYYNEQNLLKENKELIIENLKQFNVLSSTTQNINYDNIYRKIGEKVRENRKAFINMDTSIEAIRGAGDKGIAPSNSAISGTLRYLRNNFYNTGSDILDPLLETIFQTNTETGKLTANFKALKDPGVRQAIEDLAKYWDAIKEQLISSNQELLKYLNLVRENKANIDKNKEEGEHLNAEGETGKRNIIEDVRLKQITQNATALIGSIGQMTMGVMQIRSLFHTLTDETLSLSDKILNSLMSIGFAIPMVVSGFTSMGTALQELAKGFGLTTKSEVGTLAALKLLNTEFKLSYIGIFIAAITALIVAYDTFTISAKEAKEALQKATEEVSEQEQTIQGLKDQISDTNSKLDELYSKGRLSVIDQEEIAKLEQTNTELEIQLQLQEDILKTQKEAQLMAAKTALDSNAFNVAKRGLGGAWNDIQQYLLLAPVTSQDWLFASDEISLKELQNLVNESTGIKKWYYQQRTRLMQEDIDAFDIEAAKENLKLALELGDEITVANFQEKIKYYYMALGTYDDQVATALNSAFKGNEDRLSELVTEMAENGQQVSVTADEWHNLEIAANSVGLSVQDLGDYLKIMQNIQIEGTLANIANKFKEAANEAGFYGDQIERIIKENLNEKYNLEDLNSALDFIDWSKVGQTTSGDIDIDNFTEQIKIAIQRAREEAVNSITTMAEEMSDAISSIQIDEIQGLNPKDLTDNEDWTKLKTQFENLGNLIPDLKDKIDILNEDAFIGTDEWNEALEELQDAYQGLEIGEKQDDLADFLDELDKTEFSIQSFQDFINKDYILEITVNSNLEDEINTVTSEIESLEEATAKIGENYIVNVDDLRDLVAAFPGITENMTNLYDGTVQLSAEATKAAIENTVKTLDTQKEASVANLEQENAVLQAKMDGYHELANEYREMQNSEVVTDQRINNIKEKLNKIALADKKSTSDSEIEINQEQQDKQNAVNQDMNIDQANALDDNLNLWYQWAQQRQNYIKESGKEDGIIAPPTPLTTSPGETKTTQNQDKIKISTLEELANRSNQYDSLSEEERRQLETDIKEVAQQGIEEAQKAWQRYSAQKERNEELIRTTLAIYDTASKNVKANIAGKSESEGSNKKKDSKEKDKDDKSTEIEQQTLDVKELDKALEKEIDLYMDLTNTIETLTGQIDKLNKKREHYLGMNYLESLSDEIALIDKQNERYISGIKAKQIELNDYNKMLANLGAEFDEYGNIVNGVELVEKVYAQNQKEVNKITGEYVKTVSTLNAELNKIFQAAAKTGSIYTTTQNAGAISQIATMLKGMGYSEAAAAGILGNMYVETGGTFSTSIKNPSNHTGLIQWDSNRWAKLEQFASSIGASAYDIATQVKFMDKEISSMSGYSEFKEMKDAVQAATWFEQKSERSGGQMMAQRQKAAQDYASAFKSLVAGKTASGVSIDDLTKSLKEDTKNLKGNATDFMSASDNFGDYTTDFGDAVEKFAEAVGKTSEGSYDETFIAAIAGAAGETVQDFFLRTFNEQGATAQVTQGLHDSGAIDIAGANIKGKNIYTPIGGTVLKALNEGGAGNFVKLKADDGKIWKFMHFENTPMVNAGDYIDPGTLLGTVGSTGNSTGPHLHIEIVGDNPSTYKIGQSFTKENIIGTSETNDFYKDQVDAAKEAKEAAEEIADERIELSNKTAESILDIIKEKYPELLEAIEDYQDAYYENMIKKIELQSKQINYAIEEALSIEDLNRKVIEFRNTIIEGLDMGDIFTNYENASKALFATKDNFASLTRSMEYNINQFGTWMSKLQGTWNWRQQYVDLKNRPQFQIGPVTGNVPRELESEFLGQDPEAFYKDWVAKKKELEQASAAWERMATESRSEEEQKDFEANRNAFYQQFMRHMARGEEFAIVNNLSDEDLAKYAEGYIRSTVRLRDNAVTEADYQRALKAQEDYAKGLRGTNLLTEQERKRYEQLNKSISENTKMFNEINAKKEKGLKITEKEQKAYDNWNKIRDKEVAELHSLENITYPEWAQDIISKFNSKGGTYGEKYLQSIKAQVIADIQAMQLSDQEALAKYEADIERRKAELTEQINQAEQYLQQVIDTTEAAADAVNQAAENYIGAIQYASQELDNQIEYFNTINSFYETSRDLISLIYGDNAFDELDVYFDKQKENNLQMINSEIQQRDYWRRKLEEARVYLETIDPKTQQADYNTMMKVVDQYEEAWLKANQNVIDSVKEAADVIKSEFQNSINKASSKFEKSVTEDWGFDWYEKLYDWSKDEANRFLDPIQRDFGITDILNQYQEAIDNTSDLHTQQKLKELMDARADAMAENVNMTEEELEYEQKLLDVALKQAALEDARNNKTQLRLKRDAQGNYSYVYTADEKQLEKAQKDYMDSLSELYDFTKQQREETLDLIFDTKMEWFKTIQEIDLDESLSEEERVKRRDAANAYYSKKLNELLVESEGWADNLHSVALESVRQGTETLQSSMISNMGITQQQWDNLCSQAENSFLGFIGAGNTAVEGFSQKQLEELDNVITPAWSRAYGKDGGIEGLVTGALADINKFQKDVDKAYQEMNSSLATLDSTSENTLSDMLDGVSNIDEVIRDELIDDTDTLINKFDELQDAAKDIWIEASKTLASYQDQLKEVLEQYSQILSIKQAVEEGGLDGTLSGNTSLRLRTNLAYESNKDYTSIILNSLGYKVGTPEENLKTLNKLLEEGAFDNNSFLFKQLEYLASKITAGDFGNKPPSAEVQRGLEQFVNEAISKYPGTSESYSGVGSLESESSSTNKEVNSSINNKGTKNNPYTYKELKSLEEKAGTSYKNAFIKATGGASSELRSYYSAYLQDQVFFQYRTGGYTGNWNSNEGRLAVLHEKELVLNKQDTKNILDAVSIVRSLNDVLNATINRRNDFMNGFINNSNPLEQNVHIEATFPNVSVAKEIEEAFKDLTNYASQYAGRR